MITLDTTRWPDRYNEALAAELRDRYAEAQMACPIDPADLRTQITTDKRAAARHLALLTGEQLLLQAVHFAAYLNERHDLRGADAFTHEEILANFQRAIADLVEQVADAVGITVAQARGVIEHLVSTGDDAAAAVGAPSGDPFDDDPGLFRVAVFGETAVVEEPWFWTRDASGQFVELRGAAAVAARRRADALRAWGDRLLVEV
jgi:hypothetical protein